MSDDTLGSRLLELARNAIAQELAATVSNLAVEHAADTARLDAPGASFVTLTRQGDLRGCIGTLEAWRPLRRDVVENALAAAFRDPRFAPLDREEFELVAIEVSLLGASQLMSFADEEDALAQLETGLDGLIFTCGQRRSTFLPQVWESLPEPRRFLAQLKRKAGFAGDFWSPQVELARYRVKKWKEHRP